MCCLSRCQVDFRIWPANCFEFDGLCSFKVLRAVNTRQGRMVGMRWPVQCVCESIQAFDSAVPYSIGALKHTYIFKHRKWKRTPGQEVRTVLDDTEDRIESSEAQSLSLELL